MKASQLNIEQYMIRVSSLTKENEQSHLNLANNTSIINIIWPFFSRRLFLFLTVLFMKASLSESESTDAMAIYKFLWLFPASGAAHPSSVRLAF